MSVFLSVQIKWRMCVTVQNKNIQHNTEAELKPWDVFSMQQGSGPNSSKSCLIVGKHLQSEGKNGLLGVVHHIDGTILTALQKVTKIHNKSFWGSEVNKFKTSTFYMIFKLIITQNKPSTIKAASQTPLTCCGHHVNIHMNFASGTVAPGVCVKLLINEHIF